MAMQSTPTSSFLDLVFIVDTDGITSISIHDDPIIYPQQPTNPIHAKIISPISHPFSTT
jgi:hypothetical protein